MKPVLFLMEFFSNLSPFFHNFWLFLPYSYFFDQYLLFFQVYSWAYIKMYLNMLKKNMFWRNKIKSEIFEININQWKLWQHRRILKRKHFFKYISHTIVWEEKSVLSFFFPQTSMWFCIHGRTAAFSVTE